MATVHTEFGPGEIIASETVRGRTQHKVAVRGGIEKWYDESALGITRVADAFAWKPPAGPGDNHPDDPVTPFSHLGDEDPYAEFGDELGGALSPHEYDNPGYNKHAPGYDPHRDYSQWEDGGGGDIQWDHGPAGGVSHLEQELGGQEGYDQFDGGRMQQIHQNAPHSFGRGVEDASADAHRLGWALMDHDNSVNLPYDPTPQYPAIPGDTESTLQPIHEIDADERLSPADSITFEDRSDDESELEPTGPNFENPHTAGWQQDPEQGRGVSPYGGSSQYPGGLQPDSDSYPNDSEYTTPEEYAQNYGDRPQGEHYRTETGTPFGNYMDKTRYQGNVEPAGHNVHEAFAFLIPLAEGLAGAGAAEGGGAAMAGGLARGVGQGAAMNAMGGGGGDPAQGDQQEPGMADQAINALTPGPGWGELQRGASLDDWLASREQRAAGVGAGLSDRYIDITADVDYHNDPVAQFRHDPSAYISRLGHVEDDPVSAEMEHYGNLVEADANVREAAWNDVRQKAMRLRREGRVHVKDVATDRIYASVDGDHGTYDVMIAKGGAFGGFGGGHTITNWRCACEWGRWAFKRQLTYVGRLCSHGYAAYMEMNSNHMKGQPRQQRLPRPYTKRADALQSVPQRLVPELVINDSEDSQQFLDVEKDERKDTGPDDIVSDADIVHFAKVMTRCDREGWPYPRQLVAFLEHLGEDQTQEDWKVEDAGSAAGSALNEIRDWADTPQAEDYGHMDERNDDIRDAVDKARDGGTDASQLVAFRTAAPGDQPRDLQDMMGVRPQQTPLAPGFNPADLNSYPGVSGGPNATAGPLPNASGTADTQGNATPGGPADPTGGMMSAPYGGGGGAGAPAAPPVAPGAGGAATAPNNVSQARPAGGGGAAVQGPGIGNHDQGRAGGDAPGNAIGQGEYQIQQGDTLSDIAQRSGYGGDYQSLGDQNKITDYDKINAGDKINIGKPGGGGGQQNQWGNGAGPKATDNPATNAPGGSLNPNSGGPGADEGSGAAAPPASNPAQTGANPATPNPGAPSPVNTDAVGGGGGGGGQADTGVASGGANGTGSQPSGVDTPATADTSGGKAGSDTSSNAADTMGQVSDTVGNVMDIANNAMSMFSNKHAIFADQGDYDEWVRYAYPDIGPGSHQPFNGSGPLPPLEFSTSEEYADKARKKMDDVTDLSDHNVEEGDLRTGGIKRAGKGARRHVEPVVVREQHVKGSNGHQNVQAAMESYGNFNPLAAKRPEDFDDDEAAQHIAAQGGDIVAAFQRQADNGGSALTAGPSSGDLDIAAAATGFLQKTAGRNYSLAEQAELIREGDIGGAGNLDQLQLAGTHYQDESKNSVGLW